MNRIGLLLVTLAILLSQAPVGNAQEVTLASPGTSVSFTVSNEGAITWQSGSDTFTYGLDGNGIQTGTMGLSIIELPSQATTRSLAVAVRNGTAEFTAILEVDEDGSLVENTDSASFLAALASALNSQEGQEVEESARFATEQLSGMAMGDLVSGLLTQSQPLNSLPMTEIDELNGPGDCARSVLLSVYGASLAIYGCTGGCGVGWRICCGEGTLVYARSLQQIWNTCRVATW